MNDRMLATGLSVRQSCAAISLLQGVQADPGHKPVVIVVNIEGKSSKWCVASDQMKFSCLWNSISNLKSRKQKNTA